MQSQGYLIRLNKWIGKILSKTETKIAIIAVIINAVTEISKKQKKYASNSPIQAKGAPGRTGTIVPANPITKRIPPKIVNTISPAIDNSKVLDIYRINIQIKNSLRNMKFAVQ